MGYAQELDDAFIDGETANIARAIGAKADAEIAALRARVEVLEEVLRECVDDLEAEVRATHGADHPDGIHPSQFWKFQRDMDPIARARALLEEK